MHDGEQTNLMSNLFISKKIRTPLSSTSFGQARKTMFYLFWTLLHHFAITKKFHEKIHSPYKGMWRITKLILIAYNKYLLLEIDTITKFSLFTMKYIIDGGRLFDYLYR